MGNGFWRGVGDASGAFPAFGANGMDQLPPDLSILTVTQVIVID
jgi:hypothetical protein